MRRRVSILILGLAAGCGKPPTTEECDALLRRYAETLVDRERGALSRGARERLVEEAVASARGAPAFQTCTTRVSRRSIECAKAAGDPDQIERCLIDVP